MATKKPIPRAVLEERLRVIEETKARYRLWLIEFGVYWMLFSGVLSSQALIMRDDLTMVLNPIKLGQLGGVLLVAIFAYVKTEGGRMHAIDKSSSVGRILMAAFYNGFFWMTVVGGVGLRWT